MMNRPTDRTQFPFIFNKVGEIVQSKLAPYYLHFFLQFYNLIKTIEIISYIIT